MDREPGKMDRDRQSALSNRHGGGAIVLLPLDSGAWAIWDHDGHLTIWPSEPDFQRLIEMSLTGRGRYSARRAEERDRLTAPTVSDLTLEDLGL